MRDSPCLFVLGSFVAACCAHVVRFPQHGECVAAHAFTLEPGGKGLNVAVGARRLGVDVDGLIAVGEDAFADMAGPALARAGLPAQMLCRLEGPTGAGIGFIDGTGETTVAVYSGANAVMAEHHVDEAAARIRAAGLVFAQFEVGDAPIARAFAIAHEAGAKTMLNPSPFRPIDPAILRHTDMIVANAAEAGALLAETPLNDLFDRGLGTLIVTRGPEGAVAHEAALSTLVQAAFDLVAVDTLGAGDAFSAGLAASLLEGDAFDVSLRHAAACGALTASRPGVFNALPTKDAVRAFMANARERT